MAENRPLSEEQAGVKERDILHVKGKGGKLVAAVTGAGLRTGERDDDYWMEGKTPDWKENIE